MLKKIILGVILVVSTSLFVACGDASSTSTNSTSNDKKQESKETKNDKKPETQEAKKDTSTTGNTQEKATQIALNDNAIKLTTNTLKNDTLVKDVSIIMSDDKKTIIAAIQVNAATNEKKSKELVETTVRQLGTFCGGKTPDKNYLGEVWEKYDGHIRIFSGEKNVIVDGYITKKSNKIKYSSK